ncbi:hypothetical protein pdam_00017278 [Pocillopora damicornis]|uniref:Uncharacterized protein n=1 Tax=Pocillopora damicornis TaxID=46731 RepID=A0A3M6TF86_POCDA|nr:hypothetical protein pdam_00017278 [Pocillopora damicornis]
MSEASEGCALEDKASCTRVSAENNIRRRFVGTKSNAGKTTEKLAFILPHFYYCTMVWHFSGKKDSDKLDLLNKRILRFIFKDFNSEYNNLLKRAGTVNLKDKRLQNMILTIFKCLHFPDYPRYLKDMFRLRSSTYSLRGHNILCFPKPLTTSYGINSFSYLAAISWNSLPDHHRIISDFTSFRRLLSTGKQPGRESMNVQVDKQLRENLLAEDQKQNFQHQIGSSSQIRAGKNVSINGTTK